MTRRKTRSREGWTRVRFGDVVRLSGERCTDPLGAGIERYVGLEHLEPGDLRIRSWGNVADGVTFTNRFRPGQVLFGKRRAYQRKVAVADFDGICSSDIYVFGPTDDRLLPELLPFICQTDGFFEHALKTSAGSLSPRTNWTSLSDYEFDLPPVEEQRHVSLMSTRALDHRIAIESLAHRAVNVLTSLRQTLLGQCPLVPMGTLLTAIVPGTSVVGRNEPPQHPGDLGVLKVSAVVPEGFRPHESKTLIRQSDFQEADQVRAGQLLMTRCNTPELVGLSCIVDRDYPKLMLCDKTLNLVPADGISVRWLWHVIQMPAVRRQLKTMASGTGAAMKNISQATIRALMVHQPPVDPTPIIRVLDDALATLDLIDRQRSQSIDLQRRFIQHALSPCLVSE